MNENDSLSSTGDFSSDAKYSQLQSEYEGLRKLLALSLCAVFILSFTVLIFFLRQMIYMRKDLETVRPQINQAVEAYAKQEEPQIRNFVNTLVAYGRTHPDFTPILTKYKIVSEIPAPTINPQSSISAPAPTTAPAKKP